MLIVGSMKLAEIVIDEFEESKELEPEFFLVQVLRAESSFWIISGEEIDISSSPAGIEFLFVKIPLSPRSALFIGLLFLNDMMLSFCFLILPLG
jgi:hypothetical protein